MNSHMPCPVESPKKAIEYHHLLRERETSALNYGRFYQRRLEARVFATQRELSIALSVPEGHVSRALKSALLRAFGSEAHVSFRVAEALAELVKVVGVETLTMHAILLGQRPELTANQMILETLVRTEPPSHLPQQIRMSVGRGGRYIRKRAI